MLPRACRGAAAVEQGASWEMCPATSGTSPEELACPAVSQGLVHTAKRETRPVGRDCTAGDTEGSLHCGLLPGLQEGPRLRQAWQTPGE